MKPANYLYTERFFKKRLKHREWQRHVGSVLCSVFKIQSVIDFGCGLGSFLEGFKEEGAVVKGYEFYYDQAEKFIPENIGLYILWGDITEPICENKQWDCTFSIEVAEHIPPECSDMFVKNLCVNSGRYVIMSAAPPGQGGVGHINCQPRILWIKRVESHGFLYSQEYTNKALRAIKHIPRVGKWVKQNLMVFYRK